MAGEVGPHASRRDVPDLGESVRAGRDDGLAVGREGDGENVACVALGVDPVRLEHFGPADPGEDRQHQQGQRQWRPGRRVAVSSSKALIRSHPPRLPSRGFSVGGSTRAQPTLLDPTRIAHLSRHAGRDGWRAGRPGT